MALWNAPVRCEHPQVNACMAALQCIRTLQYMEEGFIERGFPALRCRIGIHHGTALIGNFGSSNRLNYTALGDNGKLVCYVTNSYKSISQQGSNLCVSFTELTLSVAMKHIMWSKKLSVVELSILL